MWPSSTCCLSGTQEARMARVSIAQARCGLLPRLPQAVSCGKEGGFQSLKRDVAFFHPLDVERGDNHSRVSIAQARCGLLPHVVYKPELAEHEMVSIAQARCGLLPRQSIATLQHRHRVSIAQARCGLLPPGFRVELSYVRMVSIAQARCGLLPRGLRWHVRS